MLQGSGVGDDAALPGGAEHLLKVQRLPLVGDVEHLVGVPVLHPLNHGGKVGGGVDGGAVGLDQNAGGNRLLVRFLGHGDDPRALGEDGVALFLHLRDHGGDIGVGVAFPQPLFKVDVQTVVDPPQVGQGHVHDVLPDGAVTPAALLQFKGRGVGALGKGFVFLLPGGGGGVKLLQVRQGEGRLGRVLSRKVRVEIGKVRLTVLQLRDNEAHLQTPVPQMHVADGVVAEEGIQPLHGFADDGGAQMTDVQGLRHVGAAVVYHNRLARAGFCNAKVGGGAHGFQIGFQERPGELQVDEARHDGLHQRIVGGVQLFRYRFRNLDGGTVVLLRGGQSAVALVFAQVGAVGDRHPAIGSVVARVGKGTLHFFGDDIKNFFHILLHISEIEISPAVSARPSMRGNRRKCRTCR